MCQNKTDYLQQIINFNSNKDIIALREKYKEPTFFEILSKQRSETTYSSFLKWMFQLGTTDLTCISPIHLFLDVLVSRKENSHTMIKSIEHKIVSRKFCINNIKVENEKSISSLMGEIGISEDNNNNKLSAEEIGEIMSKCQDRIDIVITCDVNEGEKLQIIIENKIDSSQGGSKRNDIVGVDKYTKASQTDRYYMATSVNKEKFYQLYVYLLPKSSEYTKAKIQDRKNKKDDNQANNKINENFIEVYYQDIIDFIVNPMLASSLLSARTRFFLEELKTELTFPSLDGNTAVNSIAISNENVERFSIVWENFKDLIINAAISTSQAPVWCINGHYYTHQPKEELIYECLSKDPNAASELGTTTENETEKTKKIVVNDKEYIYKKFATYRKIVEKANELEIDIKYYNESKDNENLLSSFWDTNKRFLLALMNGLKDEEYEKIKCLTEEVSKRNMTKYKVFHNNECVNNKWLGGKSSNNAETAWLIIKLWVEKEENVSLATLREKFNPKNCNPYYKSGKWLKNLFYEYNKEGKYTSDGDDNKDVEIEAGGWDFYKSKDENDKKFQLETQNGPVIMLKMWRKDGLDKLINYAQKQLKLEFTIQEDK